MGRWSIIEWQFVIAAAVGWVATAAAAPGARSLVVKNPAVARDFLAARAAYNQRLAEILGSGEGAGVLARPTAEPYLLHLGVPLSLTPGLEELEVRLEDGQTFARAFASSETSPIRTRWQSIPLASPPSGLTLLRVRLKYRGARGIYEKWGTAAVALQNAAVQSSAATLAESEGEPLGKTAGAAESYFALDVDAKDSDRLEILPIDINRQWAELPVNREPPAQRAFDFFFAKSPRVVMRTVGRSARGGAMTGVDEKAERALDDRLRELIRIDQPALALALVRASLASSEPRAYQREVRLRLLRALLEATSGDRDASEQTLRHAEELFWSRTLGRPESWSESTSRLYLSLGLLKKDLESLRRL